VLKSEVELVPKQVWENSTKDPDPRLLYDADAAVLIGATLVHDIAIRLRPDGFLELVSQNSRFQPLQWFKDNHEGHSADRPWHELWADYIREARRFSDRDLANIIGRHPQGYGSSIIFQRKLASGREITTWLSVNSSAAIMYA
jgi:hypothetical protein